MREVSFLEINHKDLIFDNCSLVECEINKTKLNNIDVSSCNITNLKVDVSNLKGLIVSIDQALMLSTILGIKIKELD